MVPGATSTHYPLSRSSGTFNKREKEKKRQQKQEEKKLRKEERKASSGGGGLDSMIAYVDENGVITSTPPDPTKRKEGDINEIELGVARRAPLVHVLLPRGHPHARRLAPAGPPRRLPHRRPRRGPAPPT